MDDRDKQIDSLIQQLNTTKAINASLGKALVESKEQVSVLMEALEEFVRRVEAGEIRSTETYNKFKQILEAYK